MSYTPEDAMWDEAWDQISQELYPEHKEQAIDEFTWERLQSFYLNNPEILFPGIDKLRESEALLELHPSASFVFSITAIELFLKSSLLKPVVHGLIHNEALAEIVVESALGQSGFDRYKKLMSRLFEELAGIDIAALKRSNSNIPLLNEVFEIQKIRNGIIHRGESVTVEQAKVALNVATAIFLKVVEKMLFAIGLKINDYGSVETK